MRVLVPGAAPQDASAGAGIRVRRNAARESSVGNDSGRGGDGGRVIARCIVVDLGTHDSLEWVASRGEVLFVSERAAGYQDPIRGWATCPNTGPLILRPNTILGVQQANRVVEVNEMWRAREKELELESKMNSRANGRMDLRSEKRKNDSRDRCFIFKIEQDIPYATSSSTRDSYSSSYSDREEGLGDDEINEFLHSRVKRGRGAIGSRMDEPGPYLTVPSGRQDNSTSPDAQVKEEWKRRVHGPEKPLFLRSRSSDGELSIDSIPKHSADKKRTKTAVQRERMKRRRGGPNITTINIKSEVGSDG